MMFYLTTLELARLMWEEPPNAKKGKQGMEVTVAIEARKYVDFLNGLNNKEMAKALWESLDW